jgi:hypothetical protein
MLTFGLEEEEDDDDDDDNEDEVAKAGIPIATVVAASELFFMNDRLSMRVRLFKWS